VPAVRLEIDRVLAEIERPEEAGLEDAAVEVVQV
jgi:hypothetical protein